MSGMHGKGPDVSMPTCSEGSGSLARILAAVAAVSGDPFVTVAVCLIFIVPCMLCSSARVRHSGRGCAAWELECGTSLTCTHCTRLRCVATSSAWFCWLPVWLLLAIAELPAWACTLLPRAVAVFEHSVRRLVDVEASARLRIQNILQGEGLRRRLWCFGGRGRRGKGRGRGRRAHSVVEVHFSNDTSPIDGCHRTNFLLQRLVLIRLHLEARSEVDRAPDHACMKDRDVKRGSPARQPLQQAVLRCRRS